ncbi:hypothetical protein K2173_014938 [Erythroxylum novogranatense]|uniref:Uncharacterized protein n=1 Tax=Erythroxylum novogranatense TaxID=1862640 RepID=A0AAV8TX97_9ROSI|nr:hypothetical protein K2173_014938 [Erythroxylum novogranatense]
MLGNCQFVEFQECIFLVDLGIEISVWDQSKLLIFPKCTKRKDNPWPIRVGNGLSRARLIQPTIRLTPSSSSL